MSSNLPWSEQYRIVAKQWVDADAAANMLEECKSAFLAKKMAQQGDVAVSKAEMAVKASDEWTDYLEKMVTARSAAAKLKVQLEYLRMKFMEHNSENATRRAEIRLTQ